MYTFSLRKIKVICDIYINLTHACTHVSYNVSVCIHILGTSKNSCIAENNKTTVLNIIVQASLLPGLDAAGELSGRGGLFKRPCPIDRGRENGVRTGRLGLAYR